MELIVELHESVIECEDRELVLLIADTETRTCHGIWTLRKIDDERKYRKRRSPSYEKVVISGRKEIRFQCANRDYVSRAIYITARNVAGNHQDCIKPLKCYLCEFKTIYKSNLKRHHERMHNKLKSESSDSELKIKS